MAHKNTSMLAAGFLIIAMLACSLPAAATTQPLTLEQQASTVIAATLTAQPSPETKATIPVTATAISTATAGSTATSAATVTITPTYSTPMLTVLESTNCREGPGQDYPVVFTYLAKVRLEIVGRYDPTNFWLVKSQESKSGTCWMWGEYTEASGSYWVVPTLTPPPTATMPPPQAPSITEYNYSCAGGNLTFTVEWVDRATNEDGYRIFRDGEMVAELPANSTSWTEAIPMEGGKNVSYYIQVYGPGGRVNSSIMQVGC